MEARYQANIGKCQGQKVQFDAGLYELVVQDVCETPGQKLFVFDNWNEECTKNRSLFSKLSGDVVSPFSRNPDALIIGWMNEYANAES